eukprot:9889895-Ditylum_brightwellii.AAC.1
MVGNVYEVKHDSNEIYQSQFHVVNCHVTYEVNDQHLTWTEHFRAALLSGSSIASIADEYDYGRLQTLSSIEIDQTYWLGGEVINEEWEWSDGTVWDANLYEVSGESSHGSVLAVKYKGNELSSSAPSTNLPAVYKKINYVDVLVNGKEIRCSPFNAPVTHPHYDETVFDGGYRVMADGKYIELWGNKLVQISLASLTDEKDCSQGSVEFNLTLHENNTDIYFETNGYIDSDNYQHKRGMHHLVSKDDSNDQMAEKMLFLFEFDDSSPTILFASMADSFVKTAMISDITIR